MRGSEAWGAGHKPLKLRWPLSWPSLSLSLSFLFFFLPSLLIPSWWVWSLAVASWASCSHCVSFGPQAGNCWLRGHRLHWILRSWAALTPLVIKCWD